jgi:hypothetical protein
MFGCGSQLTNGDCGSHMREKSACQTSERPTFAPSPLARCPPPVAPGKTVALLLLLP